MMIQTLYLTTAEQKLFDALSEQVKEGWMVEKESNDFQDAPAKRRMRLSLMHLHDFRLLAFVERAKATDSPEALAKLVLGQDLSGVSDNDIAELCFALGPSPLGRIIESLVSIATNDDNLTDIQAITVIRHSLLTSMQTT